jgi:hypothetical protein
LGRIDYDFDKPLQDENRTVVLRDRHLTTLLNNSDIHPETLEQDSRILDSLEILLDTEGHLSADQICQDAEDLCQVIGKRDTP